MTHAGFLRAAVAFAAAAALTLAPGDAEAGRMPGKTFVYKAKQVQLPDLLRDFAGAVGLPIVIADGVSGTVNANFTTSPQSFLDLISRSFGLVWYYDGSSVYVYPSNQVQSRIYKLIGALAVDAESKLMAFDLLDRRYPIKFISAGGVALAIASGPPRHLELIDSLIDALGESNPTPAPEIFRTFALTHASAVDRTVMGAAVPGVASTLSRFFSQPADAASASGGVTAAAAASTANLDSLTTQIEGPPDSRAKRDAEIKGIVQSLTKNGASSGNSSTQPVKPNVAVSSGTNASPAPAPMRKPGRISFSADETTNLVLVRAPQDQMATIEELIAKLDVPRDMVEVEATIIDISSDEVQALGFDWQFNGNQRELQLSPALATATTSGAIPQGGGFNITTLLAAGGRELLARIRALEARGTARVVSQPKVLGAANRTATLSDKRTASVRVAGNQDAKLYSVETGITLQVTPRIVRDPAMTRISMDLVIEDGGFSSEAVDGVPIAQRTSISTIATLNEGQALLVGGIAVEGSGNGRSGIPFFSRLPVIGALFRFDSSQASRRQRLFLITPKRVLLDAPAPVATVGNDGRN